MKKKTLEMILDIVLMVLCFSLAWVLAKEALWNLVETEDLYICALQFCGAFFAMIWLVILSVAVWSDTKEANKIKVKHETAKEIFTWLADKKYDRNSYPSDDEIGNILFGAWGDELANKAKEYGVAIENLQPTEETMKYRRKDK